MSANDTALPPAPAEERMPAELPNVDVVDWFWRLFSSVKLALGLILGIAALLLVSVALVQAPADLAIGSPGYAAWIEQVRPTFGGATDALAFLQLFSVANSLWMRLLLSALAVNTLVCTLNRWPGIWRAVFRRPTVRVADAVFEVAAHREELTLACPGDGPAAAVRRAFARRRCRILVEPEQPASAASPIYIYADRHRFGRLGTLVSHLAIILVLVGAVVTSVWGYRNSEFVVPEGSTRAVGGGTALSLRVDSFVDEYYPGGSAKDYRSEITIFDNGRPVLEHQTIRVNEPLTYEGIRFHQAFFGPAAVLQVKDAAGQTLFEDGVALAYEMGGRPLGYFDLPTQGMVGFVVGPASGPGDLSLKAGQVQVGLIKAGARLGAEVLTQGQPRDIGGLTFTFVRERQFSGLQVVRDPGAPIIFVAAGLLMAGMFAVFYFPHRRFWARCQPQPGGLVRVSLAGAASRAPGFGEEFAALVAELRGAAAPDGALAREQQRSPARS